MLQTMVYRLLPSGLVTASWSGCGQVFVEDVSRDGLVGVDSADDVECRTTAGCVLPL